MSKIASKRERAIERESERSCERDRSLERGRESESSRERDSESEREKNVGYLYRETLSNWCIYTVGSAVGPNQQLAHSWRIDDRMI